MSECVSRLPGPLRDPRDKKGFDAFVLTAGRCSVQIFSHEKRRDGTKNGQQKNDPTSVMKIFV